jgi:hypothetical protein
MHVSAYGRHEVLLPVVVKRRQGIRSVQTLGDDGDISQSIQVVGRDVTRSDLDQRPEFLVKGLDEGLPRTG